MTIVTEVAVGWAGPASATVAAPAARTRATRPAPMRRRALLRNIVGSGLRREIRRSRAGRVRACQQDSEHQDADCEDGRKHDTEPGELISCRMTRECETRLDPRGDTHARRVDREVVR